MSNYRKRPIVIQAVLYDGNLVGEPGKDGKVIQHTCPEWFPALTRIVEFSDQAQMVEYGQWYGSKDSQSIFLRTLEGVMEASPGDYIIRGVKGELYPCKPDIFTATYEQVDG